MSAYIVIPFSLSLFFVRDYFLLQMGPARLLSTRLRLYAVAVLASVLLVSSTTSRLSDEAFFNLLRAPRVVLPTLGLYALFVAICLWIRRTNRHQHAWLLATAPNPLLAVGIALLARLMFSSLSVSAVTAGSGLVACVWIGLISLWLKGTVNARMDVCDLDFSIGFAGCVNTIALLLCQPIFS